MPTNIKFLVITTIRFLPNDIENNSNGYFMVPGSSKQRVRQKVELYLINKVSKKIKVTRVKYCPHSNHWMIFLTLTIINEIIEQGEEEELEFYTRTETTFYETPNGWRIKLYVPRPPRVPQVGNHDTYLYNFGISNGIERSVALSRVRPDVDDESDSIHSESIDDRLNRVDINGAVVGILVHDVN